MSKPLKDKTVVELKTGGEFKTVTELNKKRVTPTPPRVSQTQENKTIKLIKQFLKWRDKEWKNRQKEVGLMNREALKQGQSPSYYATPMGDGLTDFMYWLKSLATPNLPKERAK